MTYKVSPAGDNSDSNTLAGFCTGGHAVISGFSDDGRNITNRLLDLGFTPGSVVECVGRSPLGGMSAYFVRGAVIALRDEDARTVIAEQI